MGKGTQQANAVPFRMCVVGEDQGNSAKLISEQAVTGSENNQIHVVLFFGRPLVHLFNTHSQACFPGLPFPVPFPS